MTATAFRLDDDDFPLGPPALWQIPDSTVPASVINQKSADLVERLKGIAARHQRVPFASSLSVEDVLLMDVILSGLSKPESQKIPIITLQTGCLHKQTLDLLALLQKRTGHALQVHMPEPLDVGRFLAEHGPHAMYDSVELRKRCCQIRKVDPLARALVGADAWITGQRREQGSTRTHLPFEEIDTLRGIAKYNPLADWTEGEVWAAVRHRNLPFNTLYQRGYPSIGCEPCTCPVKAGQDIRSGRWWWENRDTKECGLHIAPPSDKQT